MQTQASAEGAFADFAQCGGKTDFFKAGTVAENFFGQDGKSLGKRDAAQMDISAEGIPGEFHAVGRERKIRGFHACREAEERSASFPQKKTGRRGKKRILFRNADISQAPAVIKRGDSNVPDRGGKEDRTERETFMKSRASDETQTAGKRDVFQISAGPERIFAQSLKPGRKPNLAECPAVAERGRGQDLKPVGKDRFFQIPASVKDGTSEGLDGLGERDLPESPYIRERLLRDPHDGQTFHDFRNRGSGNSLTPKPGKRHAAGGSFKLKQNGVLEKRKRFSKEKGGRDLPV